MEKKAAGGGKSHGQLLDALRFAVCYPGSRQLMLRRTMPELERSLVPAALRLYPQCIAKYKVSEHRWDFANGSALELRVLRRGKRRDQIPERGIRCHPVR